MASLSYADIGKLRGIELARAVLSANGTVCGGRNVTRPGIAWNVPWQCVRALIRRGEADGPFTDVEGRLYARKREVPSNE